MKTHGLDGLRSKQAEVESLQVERDANRLFRVDGGGDLANGEQLQRGLMGGIRKINIFCFWNHFLDFAIYGSWEAMHIFKMMPQCAETFSTIENLILRTYFCFDHFQPSAPPHLELLGALTLVQL